MKKLVHKPMNNPILTYCIALVWIANGLFCKVLNLVPRHDLIVARITGSDHSRTLTIVIGILEVAMAVWILSGMKKQLNVIVQIAVIVVMNIIEFVLAPDLLLWGKLNLLFALLFSLLIFLNGFNRNKKPIL
ncbi:MAG TPA: DoxX-like family protein, partial [Chitinophagaceae bacterium]|nr:DoxX-like family protein [Chitinophagaceae bacterium]